ncbi:MAG: cyclase family protein [Saprospiraceae bacterium]
MLVTIHHRGQTYKADLSRPIDLSILLREGLSGVNCFGAPPVAYEPVRVGNFVGSTREGGPLNFFNVRLNPHGNGTHTECVGHIAKEPYTIGSALRQSHFFAKLVSVWPTKMDNGDRALTAESLSLFFQKDEAEALIVRTLPNDADKRSRHYTGANPPYFQAGAMAYIADCGVQHLLTDLPSVDREEDGGALAGHRAFWRYPGPDARVHATITELIYAPDEAPDGYYLLNIQTAPFDLDASPSRPALFALSPAG